jgi:hypothetical protein
LAVGGKRVHLAIRPVGAIGRPLDRDQAAFSSRLSVTWTCPALI